MNKERHIVGVFHTEQEAINAINGLKRQGYTEDEISVITKDRDGQSNIADETGTSAPEGAKAGAVTGGALGGIGGILLGMGALAIPGIGPFIAVGPIIAGLTGIAVGTGAGALIGGLIGLGIPEEEARKYNEYLDEGNILILVQSRDDWNKQTYETFRTNNSLNASTYEGDFLPLDNNHKLLR